MANRSFHPPKGSLEIDVVTLYAKMTIAGTGACTLVTGPGSKGVTSVTRTSAGLYVFLLADPYQALLWADVQILTSTSSDPTAVGVAARIYADAVATVAAPSVTIQFYKTSDGVAVDPLNGGTVICKFEMRNSTVI
jgi:hypothetical protein